MVDRIKGTASFATRGGEAKGNEKRVEGIERVSKGEEREKKEEKGDPRSCFTSEKGEEGLGAAEAAVVDEFELVVVEVDGDGEEVVSFGESERGKCLSDVTSRILHKTEG